MLLNMLTNASKPLNLANFARFYTVIVERHVQPLTVKKGIDQRKTKLKSKHFQYKFVDCLHTKKWGNIDLILTEYVEGNFRHFLTSLPKL